MNLSDSRCGCSAEVKDAWNINEFVGHYDDSGNFVNACPPGPPTPAPPPSLAPTPPPPLPACVGDATTWNSGYGDCESYGSGGKNAGWCTDQDKGVSANAACPQCGQCVATSAAATTPAAAPPTAPPTAPKKTAG